MEIETEARLVSYDYRGEQDNLCNEIARLENKYRENLSVLKEPRTVEEVLRLLLFQRYMSGADKLIFQETVPELVEHAFGLIKIVDGVTRTDFGFVKTLEYWVLQSDKAQAHGYAWELMMMNVLAEAFKTYALSDWLHEPLISSQCAALDVNAVVVGLDEKNFSAGSLTNTSRWRTSWTPTSTTAQCGKAALSLPKPSGPDIVFYIRVKDRLFPVFVRLKLRQTMATKDVRAAVKTGSTPIIEGHVQGFGRFCPSDNTFINMVIVYPAKAVAKLRPRLDLKYDLRPRSDSKHKLLTQVQVMIDESNISKIIPKSHVDFLNGIKDPMKRQAVDRWKRKVSRRKDLSSARWRLLAGGNLDSCKAESRDDVDRGVHGYSCLPPVNPNNLPVVPFFFPKSKPSGLDLTFFTRIDGEAASKNV
ncbi:hypothetical protein BGZ47_000543 [Haplosporangium gracile]|nr:hypothetical protein BGZ47_000543 [Haplosporangium gracile]